MTRRAQVAVELARAGFRVAVVTFSKEHNDLEAYVLENVENDRQGGAPRITSAVGAKAIHYPNGGLVRMVTSFGLRGLSVDAVVANPAYIGYSLCVPAVAASRLGLVIQL